MKRFVSLVAAMALLAVGVSSTAQADVLYSLTLTNLSTYDTSVAPPTPVSRADFPGAWCWGMAVDSSLNVYVGDQNGSKITKTTPAGVTSTFTSLDREMPGGMAISPAGDLYVSVWSNGGIFKYDAGGIGTFFAVGPEHPLGMAFGPDGTLYVGSGSEITRYNAAGVGTIFSTALNEVYGLAFDASGTLWGTSYNGNSVSKFNMGTGVATTVAAVPGPGGLAFDSTGQLYVASFNGGEIVKVTAGGSVSTFAARGGATNVAFVPVPLPTTAALGLLGTGLTLIRRRRAPKAS